MSLRFSIVTPSFRHARYIRQTIDSVLDQTYDNVEYRVIDGGSTDGTLDILRSYGSRLDWVSEPDRGQADAINKGFRRATGDILGWLNSDDYYAPDALAKVAAFFTEHPDADFVYGDTLAIDAKGHSLGLRTHIALRATFPQTDYEVLVSNYCFIVQPAAFWRMRLWRAVGELNADLYYAMDYDYWLRAAQKAAFHYLPATLAYERLYADTKTAAGSLERMEEIERVARANGGTGLPISYSAEASVYYTLRGLRRPFSRSGQADLRRAVRFRPGLKPYLLHLAVGLIAGRASVPLSELLLRRALGRMK